MISDGKVVLHIPVSLFDDHIPAKECLRQPLGRDKGLCVQALQAEGIKAERLCLIFTIIISINNCVQLMIHLGIIGRASLVCLEPLIRQHFLHHQASSVSYERIKHITNSYTNRRFWAI